MFRISPTRLVPLALLAVGAFVAMPLHASPEADATQASTDEAMQAHFAGLSLGDAIQAGPLTLIPIRAKSAPASIKITSSATDAKFSVLEPSRRRPTVSVHNALPDPLFLAAGRVVGAADGVDIVLGHDVVVLPKSTAIVNGLAGSFTKGKVAEGDALTLSPRYAPPALRESVIADASSYDVKTFLALFSEVAGDDMDRIPTLRQVMDSPFARNLDQEVAEALHSPALAGEHTIGFAVGIFGRLTTVQTFATTTLKRENLSQILGSHGVYAAAMMVRAGDAGIPMKRGDDATKTVYDDAKKLLVTLRTKTTVTRTGTPTISFVASSAIGHGVWHNNQPIHVVVYPHDPYERVLFSRTFDLDAANETLAGDEDDKSEAIGDGQRQLDRMDNRGTTTEFEKRLLKRRRDAHGDK